MSNDNKYMRKYMNRRYHRRRKEIIKYLGGKCNNCGSTEDLQIDHVDPGGKKINIGKRLDSSSKDKIWEEVTEKCQLLCEKCHIKKSRREQSKLTEKDIKEIRRLYEAGEYYQREIGKMFGVTQRHISDIVNYEQWKDV